MKLHRNRYAYAICFDGRTQANNKHLDDIVVEHPYGFSLSYWELSMCSLPFFFSFFLLNDQSLKAAVVRRIPMDDPTDNHRKHSRFEEGIPNETVL